MPFVRSVIAASTAAGSRLNVSGSMSANTGVAPVSATELRRRREREGRDDDLVARADAGGEQAEVQARGARVHGDDGRGPWTK